MATWAQGTFSPYKKPKKGKGNGEPGEPSDQPGEGEPQPGDAPSQDDIQKDIESKMGKREEVDNKQPDKPEDSKGKPQGNQKPGSPGTGALSDLASRKAEIEQIVPKMNWKSLIKLMVSSSVAAVDTSYAKPNRRGLTGIAIAAATGAGALKPGEIVLEEKHNKLVLVFDTSGSMWGTVPKVMAETKTLLKQMGKSYFPVTVVFFAGDSRWFQLNIGKNEWYEIKDIAEISKPTPKDTVKKDWASLLTMGASGGTTFGGQLTSNLNVLAGQGYNVMLFSDSDILYGSNFTEFSKLYLSHKQKVFWICDSVHTFRSACTQLGQVPKTFSYLS